MADEEEWSPDGGNTTEPMDDSDDYEPPSKPLRRSSRSRKQKLSSLDELDSICTNEIPNIKLRRSPRRRSSEQKKKQNIASLATDLTDEAENDPIIINKPSSPKPTENIPQAMDQDHANQELNDDSDDIVVMNPPKKKKSRKRKIESDEDDDFPPTKKRRVSANSNTNKKTETQSKTKPKSALLKGKEATEKLKEFMISQNRPHSKSSANHELSGTISVGQVQKSLDELVEDGVLKMKEFGNKSKTKIYWVDQDRFEQNDVNDSNDVAQEMQSLETMIKEKKQCLQGMKEEICRLKREPTDKELEQMMAETLINWQKSKAKLQALSGNQNESELVSQETLDDKLVEFHKYAKAWKDRKTVVMDMIGQIFQESNDKPAKILTKQLNGETDKDNDVDWENYKDLYKIAATVVQRRKDLTRKKK